VRGESPRLARHLAMHKSPTEDGSPGSTLLVPLPRDANNARARREVRRQAEGRASESREATRRAPANLPSVRPMLFDPSRATVAHNATLITLMQEIERALGATVFHHRNIYVCLCTSLVWVER